MYSLGLVAKVITGKRLNIKPNPCWYLTEHFTQYVLVLFYRETCTVYNMYKDPPWDQ